MTHRMGWAPLAQMIAASMPRPLRHVSPAPHRFTVEENLKRWLIDVTCMELLSSDVVMTIGSNVPWIDWRGGCRPVALGTRLEVRLADGSIRKYIAKGHCAWQPFFGRANIVAYRVISTIEGNQS